MSLDGEQSIKTSVVCSDQSGEATWGETLFFGGRSLSDIYLKTVEMRLRLRDAARGDPVLATFDVQVSKIPINAAHPTQELKMVPAESGARGTVRLRTDIRLHGELRPEVGALLKFLGHYTAVADVAADQVAQVGEKARPFITARAAAAAAVPLGAAALASLPLLLVAAPLVLPLAVVAAAGIAVVATLFALLALSSRNGRLQRQRQRRRRRRAAPSLFALLALSSRNVRALLMPKIEPLIQEMQRDVLGQRIMYNTGPRPTPMQVLRYVAPKSKWPKLAASVAVDFIGCTSYALPVLGEVGDVAWAPLSAVLIAAMYDDKQPYMAYMGFAEEILPFTDIIPTASLAWAREFAPELIHMIGSRLRGGAVEATPEHVR
ncbi:hypothetical protein JKP88DRAFT_262727 [Tribonema minus]|uniref:Uncharacterized protein n=1 Tax=Tribonema minus TaxID=303371 RepID=A0A836CGD0_9STRA|nr:hypothetical protein JKP88DRAFT_262727 [Tribonema minus]